MGRHWIGLTAAGLALLVVSCGTTSSLSDTRGAAINDPSRKFAKVTVQKMGSTVDETKVGAAAAKFYFADRIVRELQGGGRFASVARDAKPGPDTLVIEGTITRYEEGSEMMRFLIGMGAGSSYFDAKVRFKDSKGNPLGEITVDKNSWVLGGGLASMQTPQTFMDGAAKKVAAEATKFAK